MREDEKSLVPYTSLSHMARVKKLDSEMYVSELHNVVKLIYAETEMRTAAKAKRLEVLSGVIDRCTTMEERTKFQLQQAEVAQQPVLDGRLVSALVDTSFPTLAHVLSSPLPRATLRPCVSAHHQALAPTPLGAGRHYAPPRASCVGHEQGSHSIHGAVACDREGMPIRTGKRLWCGCGRGRT